jgi:hypothetical protein
MSVFNNEEEDKRRTGKGKSKQIPARSLTSTKSYKAVKNIIGVTRKGKKEADARKSLAGKVGSYARAAATIPVAIGAPIVDEARRSLGTVYRGAKSFGRALVGVDKPRPAPSPQRVPAPTSAPTAPANVAAPAARVSPTVSPTVPATSSVTRNLPAQTPGTGSITTSSGGAARIDPATGQVTVTGDPLRADSIDTPQRDVVKNPARAKYTGRMVPAGGGYRLPDRTKTQPEQEIRRVSDIPAPATLGAVPGYSRQVRAAQEDIATARFEQEQGQQQSQFEQEQDQASALAAQKQALGERVASGTEARDLATSEYREKDIGIRSGELKFRQDKAAIAARKSAAKEADIAMAREDFENAETVEEKVRAGNILNSLNNARVEIPKAGKVPGLTPKETSQQTQNAFKAYSDAGGEGAAGTDFATWFAQTDIEGYRAAFKGLTPEEVNGYSKIMDSKITDKQIQETELWARASRTGESPANFRSRMSRMFRRKIGP